MNEFQRELHHELQYGPGGSFAECVVRASERVDERRRLEAMWRARPARVPAIRLRRRWLR